MATLNLGLSHSYCHMLMSVKGDVWRWPDESRVHSPSRYSRAILRLGDWGQLVIFFSYLHAMRRIL